MGYYKSKNHLDSFKFALRGLLIALRNERNLRTEAIMAVIAVILSTVLKISTVEMAIVALCIAFVFFAEMFNTTVEGLVDLYYKDRYSLIARNIKDVSAGAVLACSIGVSCVGIIIFGTRLLHLLGMQ